MKKVYVYTLLLFTLVSAVCLTACDCTCSSLKTCAQASTVDSADGTPISCSVYGAGDITLVFIHGWSCDSGYWREQVPFFDKKYQVVTIDLAGHGKSGTDRNDYTMSAFGEDVKAVVDKVGAKKVILIGHSMGGGVIAQAAQLMPDRLIGLIGVDTLQNVERPFTQEQADAMIGPLEQDFKSNTKVFLEDMFVEKTDPKLMEWIVSDMSSAPSEVAVSAIRNYVGTYVSGESAKAFEGIEAPVYCVNATLWPTDVEANRKHMQSFEVLTMTNVGHFLMLEEPKEFNELLQDAIDGIIEPSS